MARETKCRRVTALPKYMLFKPVGTSRTKLPETIIKVEELEAIRLKDLLGLEQEDCADSMRVSRPTFQRILVEARRKLAEAIIEGKVLHIAGGDYCLDQEHCRRAQLFLKRTHCIYPPGGNLDETQGKSEFSLLKTAVCTSDNTPAAVVDGRFGRCQYFMIWDQAEHRLESLVNNGAKIQQGAGTGAVKELLERGVRRLVCNRIGPNALTFFRNAGGQVFQAPQGMPIGEVLDRLQKNELPAITVPNHQDSD